MTPQQVRDTANRLYNESKYAEAIPFLKSAAEALLTGPQKLLQGM